MCPGHVNVNDASSFIEKNFFSIEQEITLFSSSTKRWKVLKT